MSLLYQYPLLSYALRMILVPAACYGYDQGPQTAGDEANGNKLLKWFSHHLRYPEENLNAHKEGTIWFTVKMGENGHLLGFTPLDQKPAGQSVQRINALSLQQDARPAGAMSDEEAHAITNPLC
ncbi:MAG TPA: hypothetical protein VHC96_13245 [Puia sp.]|nr:hypothetical protein [Puia sp.]